MATTPDPNAWERAARVVEALELGADDQTAEALRAAAHAIRARAVDD